MEIKHKENLIELVLALYRVTERFPQGEPLRCLIRCQAHDFLASGIIMGGGLFSGDIKKTLMDLELKGELLKACLEVAAKQAWVNPENIIFLIAEYDQQRAVLRSEAEIMFKARVRLKTEEISHRPEQLAEKIKEPRLELGKHFRAESDDSNSHRHQRIVEILRHRANLQVKDIKEVFPQLSKRTLRRDFEYLLRMGVVDRIGEGNMTVYKLKVLTSGRDESL